MEDTLSKFMSELAKIHEENSNLIKEVRASMDASIRNQGASIKTLEIQIEQMSKEVVLFYNGLDAPTRQILAIQAELDNLGREIKKVNKKVYVAHVGCEQCKGTHYTKDFSLKDEGKTLEEAYCTQFGAPFQGGGYKAIALGFYQRNNVNPSYQE
nr:hypothetical protein [Tanacetum cinerariifolium]